MDKANKKTIFSGVQPSGVLHIGNYLGAIANWVELQEEYNCIFCVVDYHAITVKQEPAKLGRQILDVVKTYLAAGIHPEKAIIFQQSDISAHTELAWILNTIAKVTELERMTQFKDKAKIKDIKEEIELLKKLVKEYNTEDEKIRKILLNINKQNFDKLLKDLINIENSRYENFKNVFKYAENTLNNFYNKTKVGVGLFDYPVLMAADILLYQTDAVPVGHDQAQHVELARTLADRFNKEYGTVFKVPEAIIKKQGARIMGLDDPTKKMSKSAASAANYIALIDSPEVAAKKIMRAVTDSGAEIKFNPEKKPAISNLLTIYSMLSGMEIKELEKKYKGHGYDDFKKDLAQVVAEFLKQFQHKYNSFKDEDVSEILRHGAKKARPMAEKTLAEVKKKLGIRVM